MDIKPTGKSISLGELLKTHKEVNLSRDIKSPKMEEPLDGTPEESKKRAKFYLPVLHINDATQWESKPLSERKPFEGEVAMKTCLGNCCGVENLKGACCQMDPEDLEHVLGPVDEAWIKRMIKFYKKKGMTVTRHDIVIDFEEGKLLGQVHFNDHQVFKSPDSYPIIRMQASGLRFSCKFMNPHNGMCGIYSERPDMCKNYTCSYVKANFLIKTKAHPNTFIKAG